VYQASPLGPLGSCIARRHIAAFGDQLANELSSHLAAATRDDCNPAGEILHDVAPPPWISEQPLAEVLSVKDLLWTKRSPTTCGQPGHYGGNSKDPIMEMPTISSALPTR